MRFAGNFRTPEFQEALRKEVEAVAEKLRKERKADAILVIEIHLQEPPDAVIASHHAMNPDFELSFLTEIASTVVGRMMMRVAAERGELKH